MSPGSETIGRASLQSMVTLLKDKGQRDGLHDHKHAARLKATLRPFRRTPRDHGRRRTERLQSIRTVQASPRPQVESGTHGTGGGGVSTAQHPPVRCRCGALQRRTRSSKTSGSDPGRPGTSAARDTAVGSSGRSPPLCCVAPCGRGCSAIDRRARLLYSRPGRASACCCSTTATATAITIAPVIAIATPITTTTTGLAQD